MKKYGLDSSESLTGSCESGNKPADSTNGGKRLDPLGDFRKDSATLN